MKNTDYYPLLLFQVGTNDTASQNLGRTKEDFKALVMQAKCIGAQVIFSVLPVGGKGSARNISIMNINSRLRFVAGAFMSVLAFMTIGLSSMTITC